MNPNTRLIIVSSYLINLSLSPSLSLSHTHTHTHTHTQNHANYTIIAYMRWCMALGKINFRRKQTRSPAIARMADRTAPVVKLTITLTLMGHNLAKTDTSALNGPIMRQNKAYQAIFCTLKTTSGFIFLLLVVWSDLPTNRKPIGLVSKAIPAYSILRLLTPFWVNNDG